MLFTQKSEVDIHEMSPLALAFVGDAVLELLVRARLVGTTRLQPNRSRWRHCSAVSTPSQSTPIFSLWEILMTLGRIASFLSARSGFSLRNLLSNLSTSKSNSCQILIPA